MMEFSGLQILKIALRVRENAESHRKTGHVAHTDLTGFRVWMRNA